MASGRPPTAASTGSPIFDKTKDASPAIGAIAVSESDPNVIYVGTGEACIRGNIVGGNGVYKSIDAGATWKFVGLADTHAIGRLIVNPKNPDIAFVAALGHPFADNEERGIFRTRDGGKTWEKVLYKDAKTGGIDITFDPSNANIVLRRAVASASARRGAWTAAARAAVSTVPPTAAPPGKNSKAHGLPEGIIGRIGVTVSGANPNRVWAVVEAEKGGIYRSDDGGETWHLLTDDHRFRQRAWYYSHIFADPKSADTVYILNTAVYRSNDGGKTFTRSARAARRQSRAVDRSHQSQAPDQWQRRRRNHLHQRRRELDQPVQPADRAVLSRHHRQSLPLLHLRRAAGQLHRRHRQRQRSTARIDRSDWYDVGGGESGYIAPDPDRSRTSSMPVPTAARSRATITAPARSRPSIPGRSIPSDGPRPT